MLDQGMIADTAAHEKLEGGLYGRPPAEYKHREQTGIASDGRPDAGRGNSDIYLASSSRWVRDSFLPEIPFVILPSVTFWGMPIPPLPTHITMIATYVDVDPDGDVRAILSEPIGPFAPGVQVEDPLLPDVTCGSNLTSTDNGNDTENPVNAAKEGKYRFYQITQNLCTNQLRRRG